MGPVSFERLPLSAVDREVGLRRVQALSVAGIRAQLVTTNQGEHSILVRSGDAARAMRVLNRCAAESESGRGGKGRNES